MRHYSRLASLNYSISEQFYPLGSCTMKYNPVVNEAAARAARLRRSCTPTRMRTRSRAPWS